MTTKPSASASTFTVTLPKVGVGLQSTTFALILWLGGQGSALVDGITESISNLGDRVTSLEAKFADVGVDPEARSDVRACEKRNEEQDREVAELKTQVDKLTKCGKEGKRKCV